MKSTRKPKLKGSARATRAVFRALAENLKRTEQFRTFSAVSRRKVLDARRVQRHPKAGALPIRDQSSIFKFGLDNLRPKLNLAASPCLKPPANLPRQRNARVIPARLDPRA